MNNYEINKQLGSNKPVKHDLKACLNDLTKDKIMGYMQNYKIKGVSKLKKAEIIDKFYDEFITNKKIELAIKSLGEKELELVDRLVAEKEIDVTNMDINDFVALNVVTGLAFVYIEKESLKLVMPDECIEAIKILRNKKVTADNKEVSELEGYLNAFIGLYGVFKTDFFVKSFNDYTGENLTEEDLISLFKDNGNEIGLAHYKDGYIVYYENELEHIIANRIDREFKILDKDLILKYKRQDFIEMTKAHENMFAFIKKLTKSEDLALDVLFRLQGLFIVENYDMNKVINIVHEIINLNKFKRSVINELLKKASAMYDNTRRWLNNGFTNAELKELDKTVEAPKVGRNEPCPCGSGKKYKKCCINV